MCVYMDDEVQTSAQQGLSGLVASRVFRRGLVRRFRAMVKAEEWGGDPPDLFSAGAQELQVYTSLSLNIRASGLPCGLPY